MPHIIQGAAEHSEHRGMYSVGATATEHAPCISNAHYHHSATIAIRNELVFSAESQAFIKEKHPEHMDRVGTLVTRCRRYHVVPHINTLPQHTEEANHNPNLTNPYSSAGTSAVRRLFTATLGKG